MNDDNTQQTWWGDYEIPVSGSITWSLGSLTLSLESRDSEWILNYHHDPLNSDRVDNLTIAAPDQPLAEPFETERFVGSEKRLISVTPALADRSVVSRPEVPFKLLPGESADIFIGTPIWLCLRLPGSDVTIWENPINRPSDTWFGPSTLVGEVSYASRTKARLRESDVPHNLLRAVTKVLIKNKGEDPMNLERINLPVPLLTLYHLPDGHIWTNDLTLERQASGDAAELEIVSGPPKSKPAAVELSKAREEGSKQFLRSLSSILG